jgi:hypothetical protein
MKVLSRSFLGEGSHTTYPHMNAYAADGKTFIYKRIHDGVARLYQHDLATGRQSVLVELDLHRSGCWEAAWRSSDRLVLINRDRACIMDLSRPGQLNEVYAPPEGARLDALGVAMGAKYSCANTRTARTEPWRSTSPPAE